jgi:predicted small lipoprotein YifL
VGRLCTISLIVIAVGLTACGRRGKLEPPPEAAAAPVPEAAPVERPPEERNPFFLDWLIKS